jgi:predicted unusual protein kinase regulating ubiquinone biosynthesis (AarF/ABC1/UbiB family)
LQDDVPPFPDEEAFAIIQEQLGRPLEAVFSSISEQPVAAASLGQVRACFAAAAVAAEQMVT